MLQAALDQPRTRGTLTPVLEPSCLCLSAAVALGGACCCVDRPACSAVLTQVSPLSHHPLTYLWLVSATRKLVKPAALAQAIVVHSPMATKVIHFLPYPGKNGPVHSCLLFLRESEETEAPGGMVTSPVLTWMRAGIKDVGAKERLCDFCPGEMQMPAVDARAQAGTWANPGF